MNLITEAEFVALDWPARRRALDDLNRLSCIQEGRSYGEAQAKRKPIDEHRTRLEAIHAQDVHRWIREGAKT